MLSNWFWKKVSMLFGWMAIVALFVVIVFAANIEIKDLDLWLHLASGKYIIQHHIIPNVDVFSCTIAGKPWINHEWLFQVIIYLINSWAGPEGLITLQVLVVGITFVILLYLGYNKDRHLGTVFLLLLVLLVYQMRFTIRPDIFSLLFLTLYFFILAVHLESRGAVLALFLLQVLWSNIHGFFILGPVLVIIGLLAEWMKRHISLPFEWNSVGRLSDIEYRRLKQIFIFVVLACLITPYFIKGVWYPFSVLFSMSGESKEIFRYIGELKRPIQFNNALTFAKYPYYKLLIVISFFSFIFNRKKIDVGAVLLWILFLVFSLIAVRNIVYFAFIAYFIYLTNAQHLTLQHILPIQLKNQRWKAYCSIVFKIMLVVWMISYLNRSSLRGYFDFEKFERKSEYGGVSLRNYPFKAVDFLEVNNIRGNFFNDFNSGAYLLGRMSPNIKVFIDGRTEVYGVEFFKKYRKIWKGDVKLFEEAASRYNLIGAFLNSVYVPAPAGIIKHLYENPDWHLVYFDYDASIFLKDIPANRNWIDQFNMDLELWHPPVTDLTKIGVTNVTPYQNINRAKALYNLHFYEKSKEEITQALRIAPHYAQAYKILGKINIQEDQFEQAFENLRKAKLFKPQDLETRYHLAVSLYHLDKLELAKAQCQNLLKRNEKNTMVLFLLSLIYAKEKNYDKAIQFLKRGHIIAPKQINGLVKIGDFFVQQGELKKAEDVYSLALEAQPDNEDIKFKLSEIVK